MTKRHQTVFSITNTCVHATVILVNYIKIGKKYESVLINGAACLCQDYTFMSIMHMYIYMTLHEDFKQINLLYI